MKIGDPKMDWSPGVTPRQLLALYLVLVNRLTCLPEWEARIRRNPQGRPQSRSLAGSLVSLLLSIDSMQHAQGSRIDRLQQGFPDDVRKGLGIARHGPPVLKQQPAAGQGPRYSVPQASLLRHYDAMCQQIDYSPFFQHQATPAERDERHRFQDRVFDDLLAGWLPRLPGPVLLTTDATGIRCFSRRDKDPDFTVVRQTPTGRDDIKFIFGGLGNILSGSNLPGQVPFPMVTLGFRLPMPELIGHMDSVALELLDAWRARGGPALPVVTDSDYSYKDDWSLNLGERGSDMVASLHPKDAGRKGGKFQGAALIDGCLHCPFAPLREDLGSPVQKGQALLDYQTANRVREQFACETISRDALVLTSICPAQAGKVKCKLWRVTDALDGTHPVIHNHPPDLDHAPKVCQGPITVPRTTPWIRKIWSPYYYGGPIWRSYFTVGRPRAEGILGLLFGDNTTDIQTGVTNWVGQARTGLIYACALAVQNLHALRAWWQNPDVHQALAPDVRAELENDPLFWPIERLSRLGWDELMAPGVVVM